jgi:hypothetical protein
MPHTGRAGSRSGFNARITSMSNRQLQRTWRAALEALKDRRPYRIERLLSVPGLLRRVNPNSICGKYDLLTAAVGHCDVATVNRLVLAGAKVNSRRGKTTPLMCAAAHGKAKTVKLLLRHGANPRIIIDGLKAVAFAKDWHARNTAALLRRAEAAFKLG